VHFYVPAMFPNLPPLKTWNDQSAACEFALFRAVKFLTNAEPPCPRRELGAPHTLRWMLDEPRGSSEISRAAETSTTGAVLPCSSTHPRAAAAGAEQGRHQAEDGAGVAAGARCGVTAAVAAAATLQTNTTD
jgi:hypothetical protein